MNMMPGKLKGEIALFVHLETLKKVRIFQVETTGVGFKIIALSLFSLSAFKS